MTHSGHWGADPPQEAKVSGNLIGIVSLSLPTKSSQQLALRLLASLTRRVSNGHVIGAGRAESYATSFRLCFAGAYGQSVLVEEVEMIAEPNHDAQREDTVRGRRERKRREKALDEALKNTFPASDPVSVEQLVLPAAHE